MHLFQCCSCEKLVIHQDNKHLCGYYIKALYKIIEDAARAINSQPTFVIGNLNSN